MTRIAVVIPVGPEAYHADYLDEALESVAAQTRQPSTLVVVDDMHGMERLLGRLSAESKLWLVSEGLHLLSHSPPWRLGVGTAFNTGCAIAFRDSDCDLALMMGADDRLEPRVLEHLERTYDEHKGADGYYWFQTQYDTGEQQNLASNNAAVSRGFMQATGGLPVEAALGGMDAALISILLVHYPEFLIPVTGPEGRYWSRTHANQEGTRLNAFGQDAILGVRNVLTRDFKPPAWGRWS